MATRAKAMVVIGIACLLSCSQGDAPELNGTAAEAPVDTTTAVAPTEPAFTPKDTSAFPHRPFASVEVMGITCRTCRDDLKRMTYMVGFRPFGFIDSTGKPINDRYKSVVLNAEQRLALEKLLRPLPPPPDIRTGNDCTTEYRDAILFKDERGKPVAWINICFLCEEIMFVPNDPLLATFEDQNFQELRAFFGSLSMPRPIGEF